MAFKLISFQPRVCHFIFIIKRLHFKNISKQGEVFYLHGSFWYLLEFQWPILFGSSCLQNFTNGFKIFFVTDLLRFLRNIMTKKNFWPGTSTTKSSSSIFESVGQRSNSITKKTRASGISHTSFLDLLTMTQWKHRKAAVILKIWISPRLLLQLDLWLEFRLQYPLHVRISSTQIHRGEQVLLFLGM